MNFEPTLEFLQTIGNRILFLVNEFSELNEEADQIYLLRFLRLMHLLTPIMIASLVYHYLKYLLIFDARMYEEYVRGKQRRLKKVSKRLKALSKRVGNVYFYFMPMSHGMLLPRPCIFFAALREILLQSNRPVTRVLRMNLLQDLLGSDGKGSAYHREAEIFAAGHEDGNSQSEFNQTIMKTCRELVIQGVKDFDLMSTVYWVIETAMEDWSE